MARVFGLGGSLVSIRSLRWLAFGGVGVSCLLLVVAVVHTRREDGLLPRVSTEPMTIQGFRSALYDGERVRVRVSGDSVTVSNKRFLGPFRLGFMYSLVARNVTLETFPSGDGVSEPVEKPLSIEQLSPLVAPRLGGVEIGDAELGPVKVIEHRDGRERVVLEAALCQAGLSLARVVCRDGVAERDGAAERFRELSYDVETRTVRTIR